MTTNSTGRAWWKSWLSWMALLVGFSVSIVLLMLWLAGKFHAKVGAEAAEVSPQPVPAGEVVAVRSITLPVTESASGSIRAVHEATVGSKLLARVTEVNLKAGQKVKAGEVLLRLEDTDLKSRLEQAKRAVESAQSKRDQALSEEKRAVRLLAARSISKQEQEKLSAAARSAEAELGRASEALKEAEDNHSWATIKSPLDGLVVDKKVNVGDMVVPGQNLVTVYDPRRMQLVANVRESLANRLRVDQQIEVRIEGLNKTCLGTVSEIVPQAQLASRAFQVKVTGPCPGGIYSGMFGRILIPLENDQLLVIPRSAVRQVGQLELVNVVEEDGRVSRRAVRTGRVQEINKEVLVEILSGLREGEKVLVPATPGSTREADHG